MLYAPTSDRAMKFVEPSPFADPDIAARKLVELANGIEAAQDGRIYIERVNVTFLAVVDFQPGIGAQLRWVGYGGMRSGELSHGLQSKVFASFSWQFKIAGLLLASAFR
jgi:hypothetical protein